jgi:hypothetical protein
MRRCRARERATVRAVYGETIRLRARVNVPTVFLASVFDPGIDEPLRAESPGLIWDPRTYPRDTPTQTIEDVCRKLIRKSKLFVGVFDERGGHAPFEEGVAPVTVLEIELLQALFERMPIYLFLLPGFERNRRLSGLVDMARRHGSAVITDCPFDFLQNTDSGRRLSPLAVAATNRVIRDPIGQRLARAISAGARRLRPFTRLDVSLLDIPATAIRDPLDCEQVNRQLEKASTQSDHAARMSYLWPAMRQLASAPYDDPRFAEHRALWQRLAGAWDRSASWYGLHGDTPIGKLAAVNSLLRTLESKEPSGSGVDQARGARASAFYSMAKRLWNPVARRRLFLRALAETEVAMRSPGKDVSGYLAIRGSVHLKLWRVGRAVRDYEAVVAARASQKASPSAQGEAWVELGWGYLFALQVRKARHALRLGLALMREDYRRDPAQRVDFLIRALMKHALAFALMLDFAEAKVSAREGCRLARERVASDQLDGFRGRLCKWWND